jgi:DNA-directed RNA polymerase beta' subunit
MSKLISKMRSGSSIQQATKILPVPRSLTPAEIEDILDSIPKVMAATKKQSEHIRQQIQSVIKAQLQDKDLKIVPEGIPKLKEYITQQHYNSLVSPGEPVGIRAAEAIGQPTTQLALDSFHNAGKENEIGTGIVSIKELYNMSQKRSVEYITMHFKEKYYTYEDVIDLRRKIVGVMADDLIMSKEFKTYTEGYMPKDYWYNFYLESTGKKLPKCTTFLRIKFDKLKLYSYNLTPQDIADKIEDQHIKCIPSPANIGIIDFYPNDELNMEIIAKKNYELNITDENASFLFLRLIFVPNLKDVKVSGISGINQLTPIRKPVSSLIKLETKISDNKWKIDIDTIAQYIDGTPMDKLTDLFGLCNIKILDQATNYYVVEMPPKETIEMSLLVNNINSDSEEVLLPNSPQALINQIVKNNKDATEVKTKELKDKGIFKSQEVTPLGKASEYIYGITNGTNLIDALSHPLVDSRYTKSNNAHEMIKALGVEAARNFLILEYIRNFKGDIEPRHIMLCVDFQTSLGVLLPITSRGAARQQTGPLAKGSFEHAMNTFLEAAAFGKYEEIKSTSTSIFVGKRMILGTGSFKAKLDIEAMEKADAQRNLRKSRIKIMEEKKISDAILDEFDIEGEMLNVTEDMIGDHPAGEVIGTNTKVERLKFKNPVPVVKYSGLDYPAIIKVILGKSKSINKSNELLEPVVLPRRAASPMRQTLSRQGLPALPRMTPTEVLYSSEAERRVGQMNLDDFLEEDY